MTRPSARSHAGTNAGAATSAGELEFSAPLDLPGVADAVAGTANAAITAMSATIPDTRLPDFLFAISTSLSRKSASSRRSSNNCAHSVTRTDALRPPSGGGTGAIHSFEGWLHFRGRPTNEGANDRAQESKGGGISARATPSMAGPRRQAASRRGLFFRGRSSWLAKRAGPAADKKAPATCGLSSGPGHGRCCPS